jgi:putative membrane protein
MNPAIFFSKQEQARIEQAVIDAEKKTSGEIVPIIVGASARYAEVELAGVVAGLILGTAIELIWHDPWGSVHAYILWPAAGAVLGYLLGQLPVIKRRLLPRHRIIESIHLRSLVAFAGHGLYNTKDHTGILIFASLLERRVVVLADRGIDEKVSSGTWQEVVQKLTDGLKSGRACDGFCNAIERCGEILSAHFPSASENQDELPNKLVTEIE